MRNKMTYGDIFNEFCKKFPKAKVEDYRPAMELYMPQISRGRGIPNAIIVCLKDGSKVIYIADIHRNTVSVKKLDVSQFHPTTQLPPTTPKQNDILEKKNNILEKKNDILDKILDEVLEYIDDFDIAAEICSIFNKYREESNET